MSTAITLEAFLRRDYENERECEYVDGHLEERTGGEMPHGRLHAQLAYWFGQHRDDWSIEAAMSYSMWTSPTRIRVPDIVVMNDRLRENIRVTPPLLCVEVLAPEDTLTRIFTRCNDFSIMGVPNIWLLDPIERAAFTYTRDGLKPVTASRITIPNSPVYLDLPEIFSALD